MSGFFSLPFWEFVAVTAGVYALFALGLQLQFGYTGLLNFGHIAFMAIGAYTMALLVLETPLGIWWSMLIAVVVAMIFGLLVGLPALRLRADYLAITTIAFSEIVRIFILNQDDLTGGPRGLISFAKPFTEFASKFGGWAETTTGIPFDKDRVLFFLVWTVVLVGFVFMRRLVRSPWGRVLRAIREDEDAAASLGKNPFSYKLQVMAIGSLFAAIAGFFFSWQILFLHPDSFRPVFTFNAWIILLIGGIGRNVGVIVGSIIFAFVFAGTRFFTFWPFALMSGADRSALRMVIIGLILIGVMVWRPQGIFGRKEELMLDA